MKAYTFTRIIVPAGNPAGQYWAKVLTTQRQLNDHRHSQPGFAFQCSVCKDCKPLPDGLVTSCGTGYGYKDHNPKARPICYTCLDNLQREEMRDRSKPFTAYISGDGKHATTWTGGILGDVIYSAPTALPFGRSYSWVHGKGYTAFQVRDVHGGLWHGKGSPGVCITLRACAVSLR